MRVAVVGLGEAGSIYATDLFARGASVVGTDLHVTTASAGVGIAADIPAVVRGADLVLSLVGASSAATSSTRPCRQWMPQRSSST